MKRKIILIIFSIVICMPSTGESHNRGPDLVLSIPYANTFLTVLELEGVKSSFGFLGISLGLNLHHSGNQFVNFGISGVMDFPIPFPASIHYDGEVEGIGSAHISLSNNHKVNRFTFGYGLSFASYRWTRTLWAIGHEVISSISEQHFALGFIFPVYFQIRNRFNIGIIYRPTLLRLNTINKFAYEHIISLDFAWRIPLSINYL